MLLTMTISEIEILNATGKRTDEAWIAVNADRSENPVSTPTFNINSRNVDRVEEMCFFEKIKNLRHVYTVIPLYT